MYILNFYFLLTAAGVCLLGRLLGERLTIILNLSFMFMSLVINIFIFYESILGSVLFLPIFEWFNIVDLSVTFGLFYDFLSSSMLFVVTFISFLVHVYSYNYMAGDPGKVRFFCYLNLFTIFMALLVVSESLIQLFFAWEGVGITSYLLINFWYTRYEANRAALKALFINRFGDFGLYTGILLLLVIFKTHSISIINSIAWSIDFTPQAELVFFGKSISTVSFIALFLFLGVVGKSAQLGLHTWLPDAMEGPTPVSALLHAATMVTAGVYLLLRLCFFFEVSGIMGFVAFWGALTAFVASTIGAFQNDIKKIIAYSTCSQLGYMLAACGLYNFMGAYFHLFNHAFFKALLFLGAGAVIHAMGDEQDLRKFGGLLVYLPFTHISFLFASLSLMGVPFLSGFYSKDLIINWAYSSHTFVSSVVYWLLVLAAFFTAFYSTKILYMTFYSVPRFSYTQLKTIKESDFFVKIPMFFLAILSLISGYLFFDLFVGYGSPTGMLTVNLEENYYFSSEYISQVRKFIPLLFVIGGVLTFFILTKYFAWGFLSLLITKPEILYYLIKIQTFFNKKWYFDFFYYYIVMFVMFICYDVLFKNFDKGLFEHIFVKKTVWFSVNFSNFIKFFQTGELTDYIIYIVNILLLGGFTLFWLTLSLDYSFLLLLYFYVGFKLCEK